MKKVILIIIITFAFVQLNAQYLQSSVIGSAGSISNSGNLSLSSTTGETVTSSFSNSTLRITQGFQQGVFRVNVPFYFILYLQGYYSNATHAMEPVLYNQGQSLNSTIVDTLNVELHSASNPSTIAANVKVLLAKTGLVNATIATKPGNYYIVIKHRNTVETWSALPYQFNGSPVLLDFSYEAQRAFGSNQVEVEPGVWALYSGDINQDENVDLLDASFIENDISIFQYGYYSTDINGDGNVDLLDAPIVENNINNFVFSNHP